MKAGDLCSEKQLLHCRGDSFDGEGRGWEVFDSEKCLVLKKSAQIAQITWSAI